MKAILVIDYMPSSCLECPCLDVEFRMCKGYEGYEEPSIYRRPDWCPLRPLPQYEDEGEMERLAEKVGSKKECALSYAYGYNDCINDILGYQDESNISD